MLKATLKFDHAGTVDVDYPIAAIGAPAPGAAAGGGTMMGGPPGGGMMQMNKQQEGGCRTHGRSFPRKR